MEQFIPILIAAVIFGYQAYSNYQKEQEKARKRNPGQRPPAQTQQPRTDFPEFQKPIPTPADARPSRRATAQAPAPARTMDSAYDRYSGVMHPEEPRKARSLANRYQTNLLKPIEVTDEDEEDGENNFDLRDAIIKSAILERPYQY